MSGFTNYCTQHPELEQLAVTLCEGAVDLYRAVKACFGMRASGSANVTGDDQLELDILADKIFLEYLSNVPCVAHVISEEREDLIRVGQGTLSVALDPLDGSKAATIGVPSGTIFGVYDAVKGIQDYNGSKIKMSGFFLFGINLELFIRIEKKVLHGIYNDENGWQFIEFGTHLPTSQSFGINAANQKLWPAWFQEHYQHYLATEKGRAQHHTMRWYGSMVLEIKKILFQGGIFAYPADARTGKSEGHIRLIYEAIPMAYLLDAMGGASSDGQVSLLSKIPHSAHQRTPVFLGQTDMVRAVEAAFLVSG